MENKQRETVLNAQSINGMTITHCDLGEECLGHLSANRATFNTVNFSGSKLAGVRWRSCRLDLVTLDAASLSSAVIRLCILNRVSAKNAIFRGAILENCEAQGCDFSYADFTGAAMTDSNFNRASFEGADLSGADASYASFRGVDFSAATLRGTCFRDADLRGADFSGAHIENVDFDGADLRGAEFDAGAREQFADIAEPAAQAELVSAVSPLVASLLNQAGRKGVVDPASWQAELEDALCELGVDPQVSQDPQVTAVWDREVGQWLEKAGNIGVASLLDALRSDSDQAPPAVAAMLEELSRDLGLDSGASTGELLEALVGRLGRTVIPTSRDKH